MNKHFNGLMDKQSVEMGCIHTGGCAGSIDESDVFRFMDHKSLERYSDITRRSAVRKAVGSSLVQCSLCETEFLDERSDKQAGISCPNVECLGIACPRCKRKPHSGTSCESPDQKRIDEEERATYSVVKLCSGCKVDLYRDGGCNHVTCPCGVVTCYVCGNDITREGYRHGCVLFDIPLDREERQLRHNQWDAGGDRHDAVYVRREAVRREEAREPRYNMAEARGIRGHDVYARREEARVSRHNVIDAWVRDSRGHVRREAARREQRRDWQLYVDLRNVRHR